MVNSDDEENCTKKGIAKDVRATISLRRGERTCFTKKCNEALGFVANADVNDDNVDKANILKRQISSARARLQAYNVELKEPLSENNSEEELLKIRMREIEYEEKADEVLWRLESYISKNSGQPLARQQVASSLPVQQVVYMPVKQELIPKFSGDVKRYREWYQLFELYVDKKDDLTPIEKFKRLKDSLVGQAAREVAYLDFTAEQYSVALDRVKKKFGSDKVAEDEHIRQIRRLCSWRDLNSPEKLDQFISGVSQNIRALGTLGVSSESLSLTIVPMMLECLPADIKANFARHYLAETKRSPNDAQGKLDYLIEFIEEEVSIRRSIGHSRATHSHHGYKSNNNNNKTHNSDDRWKKDPKSFSGAYNTHSPNEKYSFQITNTTADHSCIFCFSNHDSYKCKKQLTIDEKKQHIEKAKACFVCLRRNHSANKCRKQVSCNKCKGRHYSIMCFKKTHNNKDAQDSQMAAVHFQNNSTSIKNNSHSLTYLRTGFVFVGNDKKRLLCRVVLDPGSMRSYVSRKIVNLIDSNTQNTEPLITHTIGGFASKMQNHNVHNITLWSRFTPTNTLTISCLEINQITKGILPTCTENFGLSEQADHVDDNDNISRQVEILIGADFLAQIHSGEELLRGDMLLTKTIFGWFSCGKQSFADESHTSRQNSETHCALSLIEPCTVLCSLLTDNQHHTMLSPLPPKPAASQAQQTDIEFLWDLETLGLTSGEENQQCSQSFYRFFAETVKRQADGRYEISLPFKDNVRMLGSNEGLAMRRLKSFLVKARKNTALLEAVDKEIQMYIDKGYAELARRKEKEEVAHFLPIVAVAKRALSDGQMIESESEKHLKVRVVKDAGARSPDLAALNDVLEVGPNLIPDIIAILLKFRQHPIALVADIEKAFLQFRINPAQRTFLRFFWPVGISTNPAAPIQELWSCVLDFGLVCSPALHCAGIKHHLESEMQQNPQNKELLEEVVQQFYVDDIICGTYSVDKAKHIFNVLIKTFQSGHFLLKKWATNDRVVGEYMANNAPWSDTKVSFENEKHKVLGVLWHQSQDLLGVALEKAVHTLSTGQPTKRRLLQGLAQIFDPLGIITPALVKAKILLQQLWKNRVDWDIVLTGDYLEAYTNFAREISLCENVRIPRAFCTIKNDNIVSTELHLYCDASLEAYGCVVYLRKKYGDGNSESMFVMAKARVTPIKIQWTIPRLELLGALMAARLLKKVQSLIGVEIDRIICHCDNTAVLAWIRDKPSRWKAFVANRVSEIQSLSSDASWVYVRSQDNPADLLSRGTSLSSQTHLLFWLHGDSGGADSQKGEEWCIDEHEQEIACERKQTALCALSADAGDGFDLINEARFSGFAKQARVLAYVIRWIPREREKFKMSGSFRTELSAAEILNAKRVLLKYIQLKYFHTEYDSECSNIPKSSRLFQFKPFMAEDGLIRCRSRLEKAEELSFDEKYPIILPGDSALVKRLIEDIHMKECLHSGGVATTLHHVRAKYLILHARRTAKKVIRECKVCMRYKASPAGEPSPPVPKFRLDKSAPFAMTGVDFGGPIYTKNDAGEKQKSYIALFACAVTRAVHLELVNDLTTYEFLLALRRFMARFPTVEKIFSDNAMTFKCAAKELRIMYENIKHKDVQNRLASSGICWQFITPRAPWCGGWYERLVQVVKRPLRKIIGRYIPTFRELATILAEIASMANSRPMTVVPSEVDETLALCPADLVFGYKGSSCFSQLNRWPKEPIDASAIVYSSRWKHQQSMLNAYWKRFKEEYLQFLRSVHASAPTASLPLKVGDICLLKDENTTRGFWPLARVVAVLGGEGTDGRHRSCMIKLSTGQLTRRPIKLLYKLEV